MAAYDEAMTDPTPSTPRDQVRTELGWWPRATGSRSFRLRDSPCVSCAVGDYRVIQRIETDILVIVAVVGHA